MGRRPSKRARPPQTREIRPARRLTGAHPRVLAAQLYELHITVNKDEAYLEGWPGDEELYGVIVWAARHAKRLPRQEDRQQEALLRIQLAEWLREEADPLQLQAFEDARSVNTPWVRIARVLGFVRQVNGQAVPNEAGAWKREARLKVKVRGRPEDRRQPHVARVIEQRAVREEEERHRTRTVEEARYPLVDAAARALLRHHALGELRSDPDDDFWWEELESVVDDRQTAAERALLHVYVRGAVRETYALARRTGQAPATTDEAQRVLEQAAALVGERPAGATGLSGSPGT